MTMFVHARLGHFMMDEHNDDGADLPGGEHEEQEENDESEEENDDDEQDDSGEGDDEEVIVTLDGKALESEEDQELHSARPWVRELRKSHREQAKRIRELEAAVQTSKQQSPASAPTLGKKPTMEDDDVDWDVEKFEAKLTKWHDTRREIEQLEHQQKQKQQEAEQAWQSKMSGYETAKAGLKLKDFDDAEEVVKAALDVTQQGIIVQGAENPALVVYALGKNPKKAAELAAIKDPIQYAFAIAKLETQLKVSKGKTPPAPERTVTGNGRVSGSVDSTLERLRKEAERTGDMSKVTAYKRQQRQKSSQ